MKTLTIREAREGLSHSTRCSPTPVEVLVMNRGEPVARDSPVVHGGSAQESLSFAGWPRFVTMPFQDVPSEVLIREDRTTRIDARLPSTPARL